MARQLTYSLECEQPHVLGGSKLKAAIDPDTEAETLAWLVLALGHVRQEGNTKLVDYLEEVADDVVFEMKSAVRRREYM